jgi:hypothetical protein
MEHYMSVDYQNLRSDDPSGWSNGRVWFRRAGEWWNRRFGTLEVNWSAPPRTCGWGVTFGTGDDGRGITVQFTIPFLVALFVTLRNALKRAPCEWNFEQGHDREIGISIHDKGIWWHVWVGTMASWSRDYPWCKWWRQGVVRPFGDFRHVRHEWLRPDGSVFRAPAPMEYDVPEEITETHPYTYTLKSGKVQERTATINGDEREWRWRWLGVTWPWPRRVSRMIDVKFSDEVGERTGSWKGGVVGTSHEWRHGETMLDALRRMERERKF